MQTPRQGTGLLTLRVQVATTTTTTATIATDAAALATWELQCRAFVCVG